LLRKVDNKPPEAVVSNSSGDAAARPDRSQDHNIPAPMLTAIGARRLREFTAADVLQTPAKGRPGGRA